MMSPLKFILSTQLKRSGINHQTKGFTLIELLVAMVLAVLVITPLIGFMISVLDSDRKEQAKATTEQELQAALDYIARDLQQAVYIYDADGLTRDSNTTISSSGIRDQIPPSKAADGCRPTTTSNPSVCTPVLVFWKRKFVPNSIGVSSADDTNTDDGFAYSLVGYYLITNPNGSNSTWSREARIGRFEISGKVNAANANDESSDDAGFKPPPLVGNISGSTLKIKMNQWKAATSDYTKQVHTLVDFISTSTNAPAATCPTGQQRVGEISGNVSGFYACVDARDANKVSAQIFLRGNALARIQNNNLAYSNNQRNYFPSASIRVQGRGFLFTK